MAETCSAFSKPVRAIAAGALPYLLAVFVMSLLAAGSTARAAETGVVSAIGTGHDTSEAITNLLKSTIAKYFRDQPAPLIRNVLQTEILPNASSFVQSYKILDGGHAGEVSLSANIDLDVIHGLLSLTPKNIGEPEGAKSLVLVRGAKLPDSVLSAIKPGTAVADPFASLGEAARERFLRRDFTEATLSATEMQAVGAGEDLSSPELLRGLGAKAGARVALGITARFETYENENSHNKEERIVLSASMVDVKAGNVIARSSVNVVNPKTRREIYVEDLEHNLLEESKDLLQDIFVAAGRKLVKPEGHTEFSLVRVQFPSNNALVVRFKSLLESIPGVRSVVEFSISRGKYDFAVRPAMTDAALAKALAALQPADLTISPLQSLVNEPEAHPPAVVVRLAPKELEPMAEPTGGVPNANH